MSPYANPVTNAESVKRYKANHPERVLNYRLKQRYGISLERYHEISVAQDDVCAICGSEPHEGRYGRLYVDHCHDSDAVRGLLCHACNVGIARFKDDPELLSRAILYLEGDDA